MKGTTNAQQNAVVDSSNTGDELTLTYANGTSKKHDLKTSITVDSSLSSTSTNPVQNKVVQTALNDKQGKLNDTQMNAVNSGITATLVQKYNDMVSSGGEPNVIETVKVNNAELPVSGKAVNIDLSGYATKSEVGNKLDTTTASNTYATKDDLSKKADSGSVYTKTEVDSKVSSVYRYKSSCKYADLPTSGNTIGDVYNVTDAHGNVPAGTNYAWNGTAWDALAGTVDLSPYAKSSEVYSKTTADSTFYKTSDTVANATKATQDGSGNVITSTYATKTEVSGKQATLTTTQMNAVNSGITAAKVSTYDGYQATINGKQDKLTFDTEPKSGSTNPVTSGGVYNAINNIQTVQFTLKVKYTGASDLSGISVTATPTSGAAGVVPVQGTTDGSGVAYLTVRQGVAYTITSSKTNYVFGSTPAVTCTDLTTEVSISCYVLGSVTIVVKDGRSSGATVTVTASCTGQTTQTKTVTLSSTSNNVTFTGLAAGTWTFTSTYPSTAEGADTVTVAVANNQSYTEELNISYAILYVVQIDESVSSPTARVTYPTSLPDGFVPSGKGYTNEAAGFTPASGPNDLGSWATSPLITGIKRQTVDSSIKSPSESDFKDVEDKRSAVKGSSSLDVFTYFPTWYVKMVKNGNIVTFGFADRQLDASWRDYAGSVGSNHIGHFRLGCFCSPVSNAVKSYGGTGTQIISLTNAIKYTQTGRGTGFDIMTWYQWTYIAMLMTAMFKTTDLQSTLGNGVSSDSQSTQAALSFSNDFGMYGTTSDKTSQMSFFWLQNIYGDSFQWCGGAHTNSSYNLQTNTGYSSTTAWDKTTATGVKDNISSFISEVVGTTDAGFFPAKAGGTETTHYADAGRAFASSFPYVGGFYDYGTLCGPFCAYFYDNASDTHVVRLSYRL